MPYICSKLTCDNSYTTWNQAKGGANDLPKKDRQILINGGAGVANKNIITPDGVVTEVSEEQLKLLESVPNFKRHVAGGFLKVLTKNPTNVKSVAADLEKDKATPITPKDLEKQGKKAGKTNAGK